MAYEITDGMDEAELKPWLEQALQKYGNYKGDAVNFTDADTAPIVMCTIVCGDELLIVRRGFGLADAEGYWSTVNGFIDEIKPIKEIARQECAEELGLHIDAAQIKVARSYTLRNPAEKRKYIVFPCLIELKEKPEVVLNKENTEYKWISRKDLEEYEILDDLPYAIDAALKLR